MQVRYQLRYSPVFFCASADLTAFNAVRLYAEVAPLSSPYTGSGIEPALCSIKFHYRGLRSKIDHEALDKPPITPQRDIGSSSNEPKMQRAVPPWVVTTNN